MKITPYGSNILVEPMIKSQIAVVDQNPLCEYGEVIAIGEDVKYIKVGDKVGFTIYGMKDLTAEGKKYYFIPEDTNFLLCKLEW